MSNMAGPQMAFDEYESRLAALRSDKAALEAERDAMRVQVKKLEDGDEQYTGDLHRELDALRATNAALEKDRDSLSQVVKDEYGKREALDADLATIRRTLETAVELCQRFSKWFYGWCPNQKCCALSGKPIHDDVEKFLASLHEPKEPPCPQN